MEPRKVLIAYTTNAGSTAQVAETIGEELTQKGAQVEVRRLEEVTNLESYAAVVVGAPMIIGWHKAAVKFIKQYQRDLSRVPVAFLFKAQSLTQTGETSIDGVPICVDPALAKPPKNAKRLGFKERYATPTNYLHPVLQAAPLVRPISVAFFGGKLAFYRLKLWQVLFVMLVLQMQPGGSYNWPFIRAWAVDLFPELVTHEPIPMPS